MVLDAAPLARRVTARPFFRSGHLTAVARRLHRHIRPRDGPIQLAFDMRRLDGLAAPGQAFMQTVQAPDIVGMLTGPRQGVVQPQIGPVDGLGLLIPALV